MNVRIASADELNQATDAIQDDLEKLGDVQYQHADASSSSLEAEDGEVSEQKMKPIVNAIPKVGRNEPCPCGSGKKFKQCHGALS